MIDTFAAVENGDALASIDNAGVFDVVLGANADTTNIYDGGLEGDAYALVGVDSILEATAISGNGGNATASIVNSGEASITMTANVEADGFAGAYVWGEHIVKGEAYAYGENDGTALAEFLNSNDFSFVALAQATGEDSFNIAEIGAYRSTFEQFAETMVLVELTAAAYNGGEDNHDLSGNAVANAENSGSFSVDLDAVSHANNVFGFYGSIANINFTAFGIEALSERGDATASFTNTADGEITVDSDALATLDGEGDAAANNYVDLFDLYASARAGDGDGEGTATGSFTNEGVIAATVSATASNLSADEPESSEGDAYAWADVNGVQIEVWGSVATFDNSNLYTIDVTADASGEDFGEAVALVVGLDQVAHDGDEGGAASATAVNSGEAVFTASALADGEDEAWAQAWAVGAWQYAEGSTASVAFTNEADGLWSVSATAHGDAGEDGDVFAEAYALGVDHELDADDETATFLNSGVFEVHASALAETDNVGDPEDLSDANAYGEAVGYTLIDETVLVDATNEGLIDVSATAEGGEDVEADADGIFVAHNRGGDVSGTIVNTADGTIDVRAEVIGGAGTPVTVEFGESFIDLVVGTDSAHAVGIHVIAGSTDDLEITNNGTIDVIAINDGASATVLDPSPFSDPVIPVAATGILIEIAGSVIPQGAEFEVALSPSLTVPYAVINNDSVMRVQEILDGELRYGDAIRVVDAPNSVQINLLGGGNIWGNIQLQRRH